MSSKKKKTNADRVRYEIDNLAAVETSLYDAVLIATDSLVIHVVEPARKSGLAFLVKVYSAQTKEIS